MRVLLLLLLLASSVQAQFVIKGNVIDATDNSSMPGVHIIAGQQITTTNKEGNFELLLDDGEHNLKISFVGYITQEIAINSAATKDVIIIKLLPATNQLQDVVVTASKYEQKLIEVPVSMVVIKPDIILNKAIVQSEDIVNQVPGVQILENQVSIRGGSGFSYGSGSRVLVLIDDLPWISGDAGDVKWDALPLENLSQMEVLKGASSVLYGSSALNGVINFRTQYASYKPITTFNISQGLYLPGYGSQLGTTATGSDTLLVRDNQNWANYNLFYHNINFSHVRKIKNIDIVTGGNLLEDMGYRMGETESRKRGNLGIRWQPSRIDGFSAGIRTNVSHAVGNSFIIWQNSDSVLYPQGGTDTATTTLSPFTSTRSNIDPFVHYILKDGSKHSLNGRFFRTNNKAEIGSKSDLYYLEYQFYKRWSPLFSTTAGIMNSSGKVVSELYNNHNSRNSAAFLQLDYYTEKLKVNAGVRLEQFEMDKELMTTSSKFLFDSLPFKPVFRLGCSYELTEVTFVRISYGEGYRFPSIAEKFIRTRAGALSLFPNSQVRPETGQSAEIGIKQGLKAGTFNLMLDLAFFATAYQNMMEFTFGFYDTLGNPWDIATMGYPYLSDYGAQSKNVESAIVPGWEISAGGSGKIKTVGIDLLCGYTYINPASKNQDSVYLATFSDTSSLLKYRNKHLFKLDLQLTKGRFSIGGSARYNSFMENIDYTFIHPLLGNLLLPGYTDYRNTRRTGDWVIDIRTGWQISSESKVNFVVNNLLNREYSNRPGNVMPPRTFIVMYGLQF